MTHRYSIDLDAFWHDPYPDLKAIQKLAPAVEVPELGAVLITRRDDIFVQEKRIDIFSSKQPTGLMSVLMGENMMRKDGPSHLKERKAVLPALNPRVVRDIWHKQFAGAADRILDSLQTKKSADLVADYAMPVCGEALKAITGLTDMPYAEMDRVSQHMIDGCANYIGDPEVENRCHAATQFIDEQIDRAVKRLQKAPDCSVLSSQLQAGLPMEAVRANIKLVISGGQNEPRDAIAGTLWVLLSQPDALAKIQQGESSFHTAFEEYARWMSPIGMSPRQIAREERVLDYHFKPGQRVFFMFGAANRDPRVFTDPDIFNIDRDTRAAISFGAGPHFCAGAAAARCLVADVAIPKILQRLPDLTVSNKVSFGGWAFRGPRAVPCRWS